MQSYKEYPAFQSPLPYDFDGIAVFDRKPFDKRPSTQTFILEKKLGFFLGKKSRKQAQTDFRWSSQLDDALISLR